MEIKYEKKGNGKPMVSIRRNTSSYLGIGESQFAYNKENMFITELKVNNPINQIRKFAISIRLDGHKDNYKQHKMSQMSFSEEELIAVRDQIDKLLQDK